MELKELQKHGQSAFRDHGHVENRLELGIDEARNDLARLARVAISLDTITQRLVTDGLSTFSSAFDKVVASVEKKREQAVARLRLAAIARHVGAPLG